MYVHVCIVGLERIPDYPDNYLQTEHPGSVSLYPGTCLMFAHAQKQTREIEIAIKWWLIRVLLHITRFFGVLESRTICK